MTYLGRAERLDINGRVSIRRTLGIAGIAIIDTGGAQSKRLYPIADHLGSTIAIADSSGHLVQGLAYADFGKRYSAGWGAALTTAQALTINTTLSDRGYSGQESLDAIGLDDYNARLYDPSLGRFLSVDPLIGHPGSTQGINPYSYVANNPLNKTDPTGEVIDNCYTPYCEQHHLGSFGPLIFYGTTGNMDVATHITSSAGPNAPSVQAKRLSRLDQTGQGETPSNTKTNPNMHDYNGRKSDATGGEPSNISNQTTENSDFAPHISVHHKGDRTDVTINLTMSWNPTFTQKQVDEAKTGIEKYWSGTIKSDGKIYSIRTHITEVGVDPLISSGHAGLLDLQICGGCGTKWGGLTLPGGSTIGISENVLSKEQWEFSVAHEFGHALGLHHQYNSTHDIMSYAEDRRLTLWDIKQVTDTYGGGG